MLHSLYRIADLCVVPSIYEPFGLVALEAMASRLPVHRRRHRRAARGRPQRATSACASARATRARSRAMMTRVLTDDALRDRLVAEASEHVLRFDWADVARQTAAVYGSRRAASAAATREAPPDRGAPVACAACPSCCWSGDGGLDIRDLVRALERQAPEGVTVRSAPGLLTPCATATASSATPPGGAARPSWSSRPAAPTSPTTRC